MLEALARGIPVLGSRRDGMRDLLPEGWTFASENAAELADTFSNIRNTALPEMDLLQKKVATEMSIGRFYRRSLLLPTVTLVWLPYPIL